MVQVLCDASAGVRTHFNWNCVYIILCDDKAPEILVNAYTSSATEIGKEKPLQQPATAQGFSMPFELSRCCALAGVYAGVELRYRDIVKCT